MNNEQAVLDAFERGKAFGFAEGMRSMRLKELTDEEINNVAMQDEFWNGTDCPTFNWHDFARAILRKAQEK